MIDDCKGSTWQRRCRRGYRVGSRGARSAENKARSANQFERCVGIPVRARFVSPRFENHYPKYDDVCSKLFVPGAKQIQKLLSAGP